MSTPGNGSEVVVSMPPWTAIGTFGGTLKEVPAAELGAAVVREVVARSGVGRPIGASGAVLAVKLLHHLARRKARYGLATLCIGGGMGIAAVFERL